MVDRREEFSLLEADRIEAMISYGLKIILIASVVYGFSLRDYFIMFSAVVAVIGSLVPLILARQWRIILPLELELAFTAFIAAHYILGELGGFYEKYWWFDLLLHDFTGFVVGMVGFVWAYMLFCTNRIKAQPWFIFVFTVSLAMAVAGVWEIFEFSMDQLFGFNMQKSGLPDTMGDLIASLIGSILVGLPGYFYLKKSQGGGFIRHYVQKRHGMRSDMGE